MFSPYGPEPAYPAFWMRCRNVRPSRLVCAKKFSVAMSSLWPRAAARRAPCITSGGADAYDVPPHTAPDARRWLTSTRTASSNAAAPGSGGNGAGGGGGGPGAGGAGGGGGGGAGGSGGGGVGGPGGDGDAATATVTVVES